MDGAFSQPCLPQTLSRLALSLTGAKHDQLRYVSSNFAKSPPTVRNNCSKRLWLHARTFLVILEIHLGWPARIIKLKTHASSSPPLTTPPLWPLKRECNPVSAIADEIWQYHTGGNLTISDKDDDSGSVNSFEVLTAKHGRSLRFLRTSWWQSDEIGCVAKSTFFPRGLGTHSAGSSRQNPVLRTGERADRMANYHKPEWVGPEPLPDCFYI